MHHDFEATYQRTYRELRDALNQGDDGVVQRLCADVSLREGKDAVVSMLALSDAEAGRAPRPRIDLLRAIWRFPELEA